MQITDEIISKFFGSGMGFTMTSIKRWGGFIKNDDELDAVHFLAITKAVSAKNRQVEFDNEVHMVNYLMRLCYWSWCEVVKIKLRLPIVLESQLVPAEADEEWQPSIRLDEGFVPEVPEIEPHRLHRIAKDAIVDRFGEQHGQIFQLYHVEEMQKKDIAKLMGLSNERVQDRLRSINRLLSIKFREFAQREYQLGMTA